jgi:hypothetical protein
MQNFTFEIVIHTDGTVEGTVHGVKGHRCSDVVKILDGLGLELEHKHTDDFDAPEPVDLDTWSEEDSTLSIGGGW